MKVVKIKSKRNTNKKTKSNPTRGQEARRPTNREVRGRTPRSTPDIELRILGLGLDGFVSSAAGSARWDHKYSPVSLLGRPVATDRMDPDWIGARRPSTDNSSKSPSTLVARSVGQRNARRQINLINDSAYCLLFFGKNAINARCNKSLILRACRDVSIF